MAYFILPAITCCRSECAEKKNSTTLQPFIYGFYILCYVLLTVHPSTIFVNNQLDALLFDISLYHTN